MWQRTDVLTLGVCLQQRSSKVTWNYTWNLTLRRWISLTALRLFLYCYFVIKQDHGFYSPCEPHQMPVCFMLSCQYKSNSRCLFPAVIFFCKLIMSSVIAVGAFLTGVDRLPWKSHALTTHRVNSLGFVCSPSFFFLSGASRLSRVWFSSVLTFRSLYYPWGKMGTTGSISTRNKPDKIGGRWFRG